MDSDPEARRLFLIFGSGIALFLLLFLVRAFRVFFIGRRHRGTVVRIRTSTYRGKRQFSYDVRYTDATRGHRVARELQELPIQEFKVGDAVTIFVRDGDPPVCEILSWPRLFLSSLVILLTVFAIVLAYLHCVEGMPA